jgi:hypothetical protein
MSPSPEIISGQDASLTIDLVGAEQTVDLRLVHPSFAGEVLVIDDTHEAEVFAPNHPIVEGLIEIEIAQLVDLGDTEAEAREWLTDRTGTVWMALFERGVPHTADRAEGLIRLTGATRSSRMIEDLAYLVGTADLAGLEAEVAQRLGVADLRPFADLTTLDITPLGATSKEARFANLFRLVQMILFVGLRCAQADSVATGTALVHPRVYKYLPFLGFEVVDLGFGIMDYKLSDENKTPMPTQAIAITFETGIDALTTGSEFMRGTGEMIARNGYSLEMPAHLRRGGLGINALVR